MRECCGAQDRNNCPDCPDLEANRSPAPRLAEHKKVLMPVNLEALESVVDKAKALIKKGRIDYDFNPKFTEEWFELADALTAVEDVAK